jgi:hypothetical protein
MFRLAILSASVFALTTGVGPATAPAWGQCEFLEITEDATWYAQSCKTLNLTGADSPTPPIVVNLLGGSRVDRLQIGEDVVANITGGSFGTVSLFGDNIVNFSGGHVDRDIGADQYYGVLNFSGGVVERALGIGDTATVNLSGGHVRGSVRMSGHASVNMSGGLVDGHLMAGPGGSHISGGTILGGIIAVPHSAVHVYGYNLTLAENLLHGTLADGSPLAMEVHIPDSSQLVLHEVPEPTCCVLAASLGMAGIGLLLVRRRRCAAVVKRPGARIFF